MYYRLSRSLRERLDTLAALPLDPPDALTSKVQEHLQAARAAAQNGAPVDLERAERVAAACLALLADRGLREPQERLVQGVCRYFASSDDEEDDFTSMVGLEDDVQVVNYVAAQLHRPDLAID